VNLNEVQGSSPTLISSAKSTLGKSSTHIKPQRGSGHFFCAEICKQSTFIPLHPRYPLSMKGLGSLTLLMLGLGTPTAFTTPPANQTIHSSDRLHRLDFWNVDRLSGFSLPTASAPIANSVLAIITDEKTTSETKRRFDVAYPELLTSDHVLLADRARAILVLPGPLGAPRCDLHLLFDPKSPDTSLNPYTRTIEAPSFQLPLADPRSAIDPISLSESILALFDDYNGDPIVRVWESARDQWIAYNFRGNRISVDDTLASEWNSKTRDRVLAHISERESVDMRKKLIRLNTPLQSLFPTNSIPDIEDIEYEFLAARRHASDRSLLTALFQKDSQWKPTPLFVPADVTEPSRPAFIEIRNYQRIRADHFLAVWENKLPSSHLSSRESRYFHIGKVRGHIQLPAPILPYSKSKSSPQLRVYLIPSTHGKNSWFGKSDVETIVASPFMSPLVLGDFLDGFEFSFSTSLPGKYFLKAIWDCRPPFKNDESRAGPGDYESDFIPFTLSPGGDTNLFVQCANHVAGGESYYKADAATFALWKAGKISIDDYVLLPGYRSLSRAFEKWIIKTNQPASERIPLKRLTLSFRNSAVAPDLLVSGYYEPSGNVIHNRELTYAFDFPDGTGIQQSEPHFSHPGESSFLSLSFPRFPTNHSTFRFRAYNRDSPKNSLFDFTLTNLLDSVRK
jgi:hypothetical protein